MLVDLHKIITDVSNCYIIDTTTRDIYYKLKGIKLIIKGEQVWFNQIPQQDGVTMWDGYISYQGGLARKVKFHLQLKRCLLKGRFVEKVAVTKKTIDALDLLQ